MPLCPASEARHRVPTHASCSLSQGRVVPVGEPSPVHTSHPVVALYHTVSLPDVMSLNDSPFAYSVGLICPSLAPLCAHASVVYAAHNGATSLVPPSTWLCPFTLTTYPLFGSASPHTSGTPRLVSAVADPLLGVSVWFVCHEVRANCPLTPPLEPIHTVSLVILLPLPATVVPPHPVAWGEEAGKSSWFLPPDSPVGRPVVPGGDEGRHAHDSSGGQGVVKRRS